MIFEFEQPFDGTQPEIPVAEQEESARVFSMFVDGFILESPLAIEVDPPALVLLSLIVASKSFEIVVDTHSDEPEFYKSITIVHLVDGSLGGDSVEYRLGHDNVVRRMDFGRSSDMRRIHMNDKIHPSKSAQRPPSYRLQSMIEHKLAESARNQDLETQMGLNNQPVSLNEINSLIRTVQSAEHIPTES